MNHLETIFEALDIIVESRIWKDKKPSQVLKILLYVHNKGWLYTPLVDGKVVAAIGAYRIKEVSDELLLKIPQQEEGTILYVPFAVSIEKGADIYKVVRASLKIYLEQNKDITEIVLDNKNDQLKRFKIKQGTKNGK